MRKGASLVSGILFLALTISATVVVYEAGVPVVKRLQSAAIVEQMREAFTELDRLVRQVASEGPGSRRTVHLDISEGRLVANATDDVIYWAFETDAEIISPRTSQQFGNIVIGSNLETKASEGEYMGNPAYILENNHLIAYFNRTGSPTSPSHFSTSQILIALYQKDTGKWLDVPGFLEISLDNKETSKFAEFGGWTELDRTGNHLPRATVSAFINSSYTSYWVNFTLESGTDFLIIGASL